LDIIFFVELVLTNNGRPQEKTQSLIKDHHLIKSKHSHHIIQKAI